MAVGDRIEVRGLRVLAVHGVLDEERDRAQPFEVDLDVWLDVSAASASDALADTVDYGALIEQTAAEMTARRFDLLEALADHLARTLLAADSRVLRSAVTVRKLRPPVALDVASVGVRVVRG
jgi:7,8-dihydroneopterin aldolase/epimerase/oxygenase